MCTIYCLGGLRQNGQIAERRRRGVQFVGIAHDKVEHV